MMGGRIGVEALAGVTLAVSLIFGGGTRQGIVADLLPQLASLGLIAVALSPALRALRERPATLVLLFALVCVPLIQLAPLPAGLWSLLPGRQPVIEILASAQLAGSWAPISLAPEPGRLTVSFSGAWGPSIVSLTLRQLRTSTSHCRGSSFPPGTNFCSIA